MKAYRYYLLMRPAMPGTIPTRNVVEIHNFDYRQYVSEIDWKAWGYVDYSEKLSDADIKNYELEGSFGIDVEGGE